MEKILAYEFSFLRMGKICPRHRDYEIEHGNLRSVDIVPEASKIRAADRFTLPTNP